MKNDIVHLTFPTDRGTLELLNKLAEIKGLTQPKLLNEICQAYIRKNLIQFIRFADEKGINITEIMKEE